jgi:hypothetical protein
MTPNNLYLTHILSATELPNIIKRLIILDADNSEKDFDYHRMDINKYFAQAVAIESARQFITYEHIDYLVDAMLNLLRQYNDGDHITAIDHLITDEDVYVIEFFEHRFTNKDFLEKIGLL